MKLVCTILVAALLGASACVEKHDGEGTSKQYAKSFDNRTTVQVEIAGSGEGQYYAVYYDFPYEEGSLVKQPALAGRTPISTTLDVPRDVTELYIVGNGGLVRQAVGNVRLAVAPAKSPAVRAADVNPVSEQVLTAVNSIYFPESTNNVRGEDLFKCTDLVVTETPATEAFEQADVWLTFLGDGGSRQGQLYGKLWFYTYETARRANLTRGDCTFYGVKNDEVVPVDFADIQAGRSCVFDTKAEIVSGIPSYKRHLLGRFDKGLSIGFVYSGNSVVQFTTPMLNAKVANCTLKYGDKSGSFQIVDKYVANGFVRHIRVGDFEGNVLGMENRSVTESTKYDGDYNDILCLIETNPVAIEPEEEIGKGDTGTSGEGNVDKKEYRVTAGIYLFEDNYPYTGDFDFNDAVVEYRITDYYKSSNKAKQVAVRVLATGAQYDNEFGFKTVGGSFSPFADHLSGYRNVYSGQSFETVGETVSYTLYGDIVPYLNNGKGYIYQSTVHTKDYPYVLEIPLSDPDDASWRFEWPQEMKSIDECYYFLHAADGGPRAKDWYRTPRPDAPVFRR